MTKEGNKALDLTKDRVREQFADETDPRAIKRFTAACEYLEGLSAADIEAKCSSVGEGHWIINYF